MNSPTSISPTRHVFFRKSRVAVATILMASGIAGLASASVASATGPVQRGVVIGVHPVESSAAFIANYHLPFNESEGGRFAIVKVIDGAWGEGSFALVYVPQQLAVESFDIVDLDSPTGDVLTRPGRGVVARVSPGPSSHKPTGLQ